MDKWKGSESKWINGKEVNQKLLSWAVKIYKNFERPHLGLIEKEELM
jgi:hypothetical protein